jgi:hypothetical protein
MPVRMMPGVVAVACTALVLAQFPGQRPETSAVRSFAALSAKAPQPAQNLQLTSAVRTSLIDAAASQYGLPDSAFVGLSTGLNGYAAYYAYDPATSTYWAGTSLVPNPNSQKAKVVVQDDGAYLIFNRTVHGAWHMHQVGYSNSVGTCALYHVSIPAAVVAVWHWVPGTCHPPVTTTAPKGTPKPTDFTLAEDQWEFGAASSSAAEGARWVAAAKDLKEAPAAKGPPGKSGYGRAASELLQLAALPDAMQTPAQQDEAKADFQALNAFFGTNGLYGVSAPSATPAAFVVTLRQEALIGTLSVIADPQLGNAPSTYPDAVVTCPVLTSLAINAAFGCKLATATMGSHHYFVYYFVGTFVAAHATSYVATIVYGSPVFKCTTDGLKLAEQLVAKRMGGGCI